MLGGSRRPVTKPKKLTPQEAADFLKAEAKKYPWLAIVLVGSRGETVSARLPETEIVQKVASMGGAVGLVGLIFFNKQWIVHVRPFVPGDEAHRLLTSIGQGYLRIVGEQLAAKFYSAAKKSPISALVWSDGVNTQLQYDWQQQMGEWKGSGAVLGLLYLEKVSSGITRIRCLPLDETFREPVTKAASDFRAHLEAIRDAAAKLRD